MNKKAAAPYHTAKPLAQLAPIEDFALLAHLDKTGDFNPAKSSWLCSLFGLANANLLISSPGFEQGRWHLVFGTAGGSATLGLPFYKNAIGDKTFWKPGNATEYKLIPIVNLDEWTATSFQFRSPLWYRITTGRFPESSAPVMVQDDGAPEEGLVKHALRKGWWKAPISALRRFCKHRGVAFNNTDRVGPLLLKAAKHEWGEEFDEELALLILQARMVSEDQALRLLCECEDAEDALDKSDQKELDTAKQAYKKEREPLVREIHSLAKKVKQRIQEKELEEAVEAAIKKLAPNAKAKAKAKAREHAEAAFNAKRARTYPNKIDFGGDVPSVEDIEALCPPGCKVSYDSGDQCFRLSAYRRFQRTRSLRKYNPYGAAKNLVEEAWRIALDMGFETAAPFDNFRWMV